MAFEVDEISPATREGWSILIQGSAHQVDSETERASVMQSGVEPWAGGEKELFIRVSRPGSPAGASAGQADRLLGIAQLVLDRHHAAAGAGPPR